MSEKNTLQEYCQKNKLSMPIYHSWSKGEPHRLSWSASVTIKIHDKNITIDTIVPISSKISAEKQAARMMLDYIENEKLDDHNKISNLTKLKNKTKLSIISTHKSVFSNKYDTNIIDDIDNIDDIDIVDNNNDNSDFINNIYLIDLENKPCFKYTVKNNSLYIGFLNSIHHSINKYNHWHKCKTDDIAKEIEKSRNCKLLYLVDGGINDLVDHFMSLFVYPIVNYIMDKNITPVISIISGDHAGWCTRTCLEKVLKWRKNDSIEIINSGSMD